MVVLLLRNKHDHATVNRVRRNEPAEGLHRDVRPGRREITAVVELGPFALPTLVVAGSHRRPQAPREPLPATATTAALHPMYDDLPAPRSPRVGVGDVLLFDGLTFHGSAPNPEGLERCALTWGFCVPDYLDSRNGPGGGGNPNELLVAGDLAYLGDEIEFAGAEALSAYRHSRQPPLRK
jgi:ectoine hydroxylase-related dioxygenase (phytanoyl-CoA dioxygenase family)